ncbi:MAG: YbaK/EbsC family protein [Gemmataceae bacterium]|nr:YbaK/EbsC family protein [Gemmataceae bacterium]
MRIYQFLDQAQVPFEILQHAPAFSAQKLAKYLHLPGRVIAKSVLLKTLSRFFIAILQADERLDKEKLKHEFSEKVGLANPMEIQDHFPDCEWGVVPGLGAPYGLEVVMEESLLATPHLILAGHSHLEAIKLRLEDLIRVETPKQLSLIAGIRTPV